MTDGVVSIAILAVHVYFFFSHLWPSLIGRRLLFLSRQVCACVCVCVFVTMMTSVGYQHGRSYTPGSNSTSAPDRSSAYVSVNIV
ncbi:hypothetical protein QBC44DRAFT_326710 [Cladorrhinum sp. PSN332]|nr:hypothetical protein QBC44DRAFT_326710 [Cladorrhinum sp. PSN332]